MAKMKEMTKNNANIISAAVIAELRNIEDKFGIKFKDKGGRFGSTSLDMKLEISLVSSDGTVLSKEAEAFKQMATLIGFKESDFGREFSSYDGTKFTISGYNSRARKNKIHAIKVGTDQTYVFTVAAVQAFLK